MRRNLKTPGGQWAAAMIQQEHFPDDGAVWAAALAAKVGVATLIVVDTPDTEPDPRTGTLLDVAPPPPAPPTEQEQAIEALHALDPSQIADPAAREFLTKLRDLVAGTPTVMEQAAANVTRGIP